MKACFLFAALALTPAANVFAQTPGTRDLVQVTIANVLQNVVNDTTLTDPIIVVASGSYPQPLTISRSLTLVAAPGSVVTVGALNVDGLTSADHVTIRGIRFETTSPVSQPAVRINGPGNVYFEDCQAGVSVPSLALAGTARPAVLLEGVVGASRHVTFVRCDIDGANAVRGGPLNITMEAGLALRAKPSGGTTLLDLWDCDLNGGRGFNGNTGGAFGPAAATDGANGAIIRNVAMHVSGSTIEGGAGGNGAGSISPGCIGGNGGDGLFLRNSAGSVRDSQFLAGAGGLNSCIGTFPGVALNETGGLPLVSVPGTAFSLELPATIMDGTAATFDYLGDPGALYITNARDALSFLDLFSSQGGVGLVPIPGNQQDAGGLNVVTGANTNTVPYTIGLLAGEGMAGVFQPACLTTSSGIYYGAPSLMVIE